jgi:hypothetical protein
MKRNGEEKRHEETKQEAQKIRYKSPFPVPVIHIQRHSWQHYCRVTVAEHSAVTQPECKLVNGARREL